ncbi:hypothetical protein [Allorhizocola rhizosphaerae]|uniref:hypothetical protein n=1 Tax=Allorhizocola rhizosphaerae TaxID=1872709 RepID=UPI000E3CA238|nr:hypothetical protein [Allorhizocola rhizosphaerae]
MWGATVDTKRDTEVDREIGINTYLEIYGKPSLAAIRAAGMSAIHGHADAAVGNETVAWFLADEPEQFGQGSGEVLNYLKRHNAKFPKDGRMRYTNFTGNMVLPNYSPGDRVASASVRRRSARRSARRSSAA